MTPIEWAKLGPAGRQPLLPEPDSRQSPGKARPRSRPLPSYPRGRNLGQRHAASAPAAAAEVLLELPPVGCSADARYAHGDHLLRFPGLGVAPRVEDVQYSVITPSSWCGDTDTILPSHWTCPWHGDGLLHDAPVGTAGDATSSAQSPAVLGHLAHPTAPITAPDSPMVLDQAVPAALQ